MPRPIKPRWIGYNHRYTFFEPVMQPSRALPSVDLSLDEIEALRLADLEGMNHNEAADKMSVSRQTFGRILNTARAKTASALVEGKVISIQGGTGEFVQGEGPPYRRRGRHGHGHRGSGGGPPAGLSGGVSPNGPHT